MPDEKRAVLPSPPDERDYTVSAALEISGDVLPEEFFVWQPPAENQGCVGNCVAQALANIMECIDHQTTHCHTDYSVGYIYGTTNMVGMVPRKACDALLKEGDVPRSVWECLKENPECWQARQSVGEEVKSKVKRVLKYVRLYTYDELRAFIYRYRLPVMLIAPAVKLGGITTVRHAVACFGWQSEKTWREMYGEKYSYCQLRYTNSYGTAVRNGIGYAAFEYMEEIWGIVPMEEKRFDDVPDGLWSTDAIYDAVSDGIFEGYEDGTFRPKNNLTREEYAVMWQRMKRWMEKKYDTVSERNR